MWACPTIRESRECLTYEPCPWSMRNVNEIHYNDGKKADLQWICLSFFSIVKTIGL